MRARALFALLGAMALALTVASPAAAKGAIAEANISGPGLGGGTSLGGGGAGGMRIDAPTTDRMWESGIMEYRHDSLTDLGLTPASLGPKYLVTYRFDFGPGTLDDVMRQDLYPYAKGGPVTYTPPGQQFTSDEFDAPLAQGWFQAEPGFLEFLVEQGLPATKPVAASAAAPRGDHGPVAAPVSRSALWAWILVGLAGVAALSLIAPGVRRRVLVAVTRMNH